MTLWILALVAGLMASPDQSRPLPVYGGDGGGGFSSDCSGDYVVGVYLRSGEWIDAIGLKCGSFDARRGTFTLPAWNKPYHGGNGGGPQEAVCPGNNFYVSAIKVGFTRDAEALKYADYVQFTCRPIADGAAVTLCLHTGSGCWDDPPDGPRGRFVAAPSETPCLPGEAAVGIHGRSGHYVDAVGLLCGPRPTVLPPPARPGPAKMLGKWRFYAIAKTDVDVYAGPGGNSEKTGTIMRAGVKALSLRVHPDGWHRLQLACDRAQCWVEQAHLRVVGVPPGGAACPAGTRREADGCHFPD